MPRGQDVYTTRNTKTTARTLLAAFSISIAITSAGAAQITEHSDAAVSSAWSTGSKAVRPRIGLALEGGGALGVAHIGVLLWLQEHHIPVDAIAGTSMGALVGALGASGDSAAEIEHLAVDTNFNTLFSLKPSLNELDYRRRMDRDEMPQAISIGLRHGSPSVGDALIADSGLNAFLGRQLVAYNSENLQFDSLPIPFRCVATNLTTLHPAVFSSGSLPFAVRASISIPGIFPPVRRGSDLLVDGATVDNLPTDVLRRDLHAQVVISVYLGDSPFPQQDQTSLVGIFERTLEVGSSRNVRLNRGLANIEIAPDLSGFSVMDYDKAKALVKAGYDAAEQQRAKLLPLALSPADWRVYEGELVARRRQPQGTIRIVESAGPDAAVSVHIDAAAKKLVGHPFSATSAEAIVAGVRSNGALDAFYETFQSGHYHSGVSSGGSPITDDGVKIFWNRNPDGPPYLLLGAEVQASTSNVTSSIFDLRLIDQNFGGYGSELRTSIRVGYLTQLETEYYRPLGSSGLFVQPHVQLLREPVYIWDDQKITAERFLQRAGGGLDLGTTIHQDFLASLEYRASTLRWDLASGVDPVSPGYSSGRVESAAVHVAFSTRTAAIAAPRGTQVDFTVGHLFDTTESPTAPFAKVNARQTFTVRSKNLVSLSSEIDTYFRSDVSDSLRFTLGGPLRLYASSVDEYRGSDIELARAIYLRRIAPLPTGIGQGVYVAGGYEQGNIWSPERPAIFRQDGFGGIMLSTPFGALTLGGAIGNDDHRKMFFTFGKLF